MNFCIRVEAGSGVGLGHLSRARGFCEVALQHGDTVSVVVAGDADVSRFPCPVIHLGNIGLQEEIGWWGGSSAPRADVLIADFLTPKVLSQVKLVGDYFRFHQKTGRRVVYYDGLGEDSLAERWRYAGEIPADVMISPYLGSKESSRVPHSLVGPDYFQLTPSFVAALGSKPQKQKSNLLVTFGGSDPGGLTARLLEAWLESRTLPGPVIDIVVGPFFSKELKVKIASFHEQVAGAVLHNSPENLAEVLSTARWAITNGGLTKYELAYAGVRTMLLVETAEQKRKNQEYIASGVAADLGVATETSNSALAWRVEQNMVDQRSWDQRVEAGKRLIDGRGAERIHQEIVRLFGNSSIS